MLFAGLAIGALSPSLRIPEVFTHFGLIVFMYAVGISASAGFFHSIRTTGLRDIALIAVGFIPGMIVLFFLPRIMGVSGSSSATLFAGAFSSTSGLAEITDILHHAGKVAEYNQAVVAFSLSYPIGVLVPILGIAFFARFWGESKPSGSESGSTEDMNLPFEPAIIHVTKQEAFGRPIRDSVPQLKQHQVVFGELIRGGLATIATSSTVLQPGDRVSVVALPPVLLHVAEELGEIDHAPTAADSDLGRFEMMRFIVSSPQMAGQSLKTLRLPQGFGIKVLRISRNDLEFIPTHDSHLEIGDRLRVLGVSNRIDEYRKLFGDSLEVANTVDFLGLGLGVSIGIIIGLIPFSLGPFSLGLGMSAGPLLAGLLLPRFVRIKAIGWSLPTAANQTLRQMGLLFFTAGIGTQAGILFWQTLASRTGIELIGWSFVAAIASVITVFVIGRRLFNLSLPTLCGIISGGWTQALSLDFARQLVGNDIPSQGYAELFAPATVVKIILCQILLLWMK